MLIINSSFPQEPGLGLVLQPLVWQRPLNVRLYTALETYHFRSAVFTAIWKCHCKPSYQGHIAGKTANFQDKPPDVCYRMSFIQGFDHLLIALTEIRPLNNAKWLFLTSNSHARLRGASKRSLLGSLRRDVSWTIQPWLEIARLLLQGVILLRHSLLPHPLQKHSCHICTHMDGTLRHHLSLAHDCVEHVKLFWYTRTKK